MRAVEEKSANVKGYRHLVHALLVINYFNSDRIFRFKLKTHAEKVKSKSLKFGCVDLILCLKTLKLPLKHNVQSN